MQILKLVFLVATLVSVGCGRASSKSPKKIAGGEGQVCLADGSCALNLECVSDICRAASENNISPNNISPNVRPNNISPNAQSFCSDGVLDAGELCDGSDLNGKTCAGLGYAGGTLLCTSSCVFDESNCLTPPSCGNGVLDAGEVCDGANLNGQTCEGFGLESGVLRCDGACQTYVTTGCLTAMFCGDGVRNGAEQCDVGDLGGQSCMSLGALDGTLRCNVACGYDTELCDWCGNDVIDAGEFCDGDALNGETCLTLTGMSGTLRCKTDCSDYDEAMCGAPPLMCEFEGIQCVDGDFTTCVCNPCVDDNVCAPAAGPPDDCVCADCQTNPICATCDNNGICNPFFESCACADCAAHPECAP